MGIMLSDILTGLGNAASTYAGVKEEDKKREFAKKLEAERDARTKQNEIDREKREEARKANVVAYHEMFSKDGVLYQRGYNSNDKLLTERIADPLTIKRINQEEESAKLTLEEKLLRKQEAEKKLGYMDEDHKLDTDYKRSGIAENLAQAARANRPDKPDRNAPEDDSLPSLVNGLVKEMDDLTKSYVGTEVERPDGTKDEMTQADIRDIARESIKRAAQRGLDARTVFEQALKNFGKHIKR